MSALRADSTEFKACKRLRVAEGLASTGTRTSSSADSSWVAAERICSRLISKVPLQQFEVTHIEADLLHDRDRGSACRHGGPADTGSGRRDTDSARLGG